MNANDIKELKDLVQELGIEATFTTLEDDYPREKWMEGKYGVMVRLAYDGRLIDFPYFYGHFNLPGSDEFPTVSDLVWSISTETESVSDHDFEGWCAEFGYDSDSISQLKTYEALKVRAAEWSEFIGNSDIEFDLRVAGWEY